MENESFWQRFKCEIFTPIKSFWIYRSTFKELNEIRTGFGLPSNSPFESQKNTLFFVDSFFGFEVRKRRMKVKYLI